MEGIRALRTLRRTIEEFVNHVLSQRFFHDRLSVSVLTAALAVNVGAVFVLALHVRPADNQVPVHFSSFTLFDQLGPWYYPYEIALVALLITIVNSVFAYHSFGRSRLASFFLLVTATVVGIFSFIIAQAFGAVR
ncbi:MAG TPA: hypothetical protein VHQ86_04125 [Candidatus Saccharimonadia bacterium]|jgi:hypothetical protein|nr:hypothetical protein [Candidatus Saccharimonadia bacterium]